MSSFALPALPVAGRLEVLQVDAAPLIRHVLDRLDLPCLLERHLPCLPGRQADVPSSTILCALLSNILLSRQPLYAMSSWASTFVPQHLGLLPGQAALLNDDRCGRALDHLFVPIVAACSLPSRSGLSATTNWDCASSIRTPRPLRSRENTPTNPQSATPSVLRVSPEVTTKTTALISNNWSMTAS